MAKLPSVATTRGSISSTWRNRYGSQDSISIGCGSRLPGGRHLSTLQIHTSLRSIPIPASSSVRSPPGAPDEREPLAILLGAWRLARRTSARRPRCRRRRRRWYESRRAGISCTQRPRDRPRPGARADAPGNRSSPPSVRAPGPPAAPRRLAPCALAELGIASLLLTQVAAGLDQLEGRALSRVHPRGALGATAPTVDRLRPGLDQLLEAASAALAPELVDRHGPMVAAPPAVSSALPILHVGRDPTGVDRPSRTATGQRRDVNAVWYLR